MRQSKLAKFQVHILLLLAGMVLQPAMSQNPVTDWESCKRILDNDPLADPNACVEIARHYLETKGDKKKDKLGLMLEWVNAFFTAGQIEEALTLNSLATDYALKHDGPTKVYYTFLSNQFFLAARIAEYPDFFRLGDELISLSDKLFKDQNPDVPLVYMQMGIRYMLQDDYGSSIQSFDKALTHQEYLNGKEDVLYGWILIRAAEVHHLTGNNLRAEKDLLEALQLKKDHEWQETEYEASAYNLLMMTYHAMENEEAMFTYMTLLMEEIQGWELSESATHLINAITIITHYDLTYGTRIIFESGLDTLAIQLLESLDLQATDRMVLSNIYINIGNIYLIDRNYPQVYSWYKKALLLEPGGPQLVVRNTLALCAEKMGNIAEASEIHKENMNLMRKAVHENYAFLTEEAQLSLLSSLEFTTDCILSFGIRHQEEIPEWRQHVANTALLFQGASLRHISALRRQLSENATEKEKVLIEYWLGLRRQAAEYKETDPDASQAFWQEATRIENEFSQKLRLITSNTNNSDWQELQKQVLPNKSYIQFIQIRPDRYFLMNDTLYYAVLTQYGDLQPELVYLCSQSSLNNLLQPENQQVTPDFLMHLYQFPDPALPDDTLWYKGYKLFELTWKPLLPYLDGADTLIYSSMGTMNRISLQAVPINNSTYMMDAYYCKQQIDLCQSSTGSIDFDELHVIGDLWYESDMAHSEKTDSDTERGGVWKNLPGTRIELQFLQEEATKNNWNFQAYRGLEADEEKVYSGNLLSADVVHIATHGFFLPYDTLTLQPGHLFAKEKNVMDRCGLVLSNAGPVWEGNISKGPDDGILTASELINIDLSATGLVVLSACETGLGDVRGNEGVFGLQRAFKIAGTPYLVMSLWKIPDAQTAALMKEFYKAIFSGKDPNTALRMAQQTRSKYTNPYNWAAFVLIE